MKKIISFFLLTAVLFTSCKKDEINNTEDKVGISRVTRFPSFTINGDQYISIVQGNSYTDLGATAKEGETDLQVQAQGQVNTNEVGVYDIVYSAVNKDGFAGSVTRTVAVLPAAEQAGVDISGKYKYATSAVVSTIQKLAPGFYLSSNIWGGSTIPSYVLTVDGQNLILPLSGLSPYGRSRGTGTLTSGNLTYVVDLLDQGITASTRRWVKQ
jgi:Domain of unknown function (DUF5011)